MFPVKAEDAMVLLLSPWAKQLVMLTLHRAGDGALRRRLIKLSSAGWLPPSVFRLGAVLGLEGGRRAS